MWVNDLGRLGYFRVYYLDHTSNGGLTPCLTSVLVIGVIVVRERPRVTVVSPSKVAAAERAVCARQRLARFSHLCADIAGIPFIHRIL